MMPRRSCAAEKRGASASLFCVRAALPVLEAGWSLRDVSFRQGKAQQQRVVVAVHKALVQDFR